MCVCQKEAAGPRRGDGGPPSIHHLIRERSGVSSGGGGFALPPAPSPRSPALMLTSVCEDTRSLARKAQQTASSSLTPTKQQNLRRGGVQGVAGCRMGAGSRGLKGHRGGSKPSIKGELVVKTTTRQGVKGAERLKLETSSPRRSKFSTDSELPQQQQRVAADLRVHEPTAQLLTAFSCELELLFLLSRSEECCREARLCISVFVVWGSVRVLLSTSGHII